MSVQLTDLNKTAISKQTVKITVSNKKGKVVVEGVNKVKRHTKPNVKAPQGGILVKEAPMHACKVMLVCPACSKATRVAHKEVNGKNVRVCKKCGETIDQTK